jgi:GNAT superfamily N-acetyltransferase
LATLTDTLETVFKATGLPAYLTGLTAVALAFKTAAAEQDKLFRGQLLFNRLGLAGSFDATTLAVDRLARRTGYARQDIQQVVDQLAQAGIKASLIPQALKDIADAAAGNAQGTGFLETGDAFTKAVLGKERALEHFGITLQATGSRMGNLNRVENEFQKRFFGDAGLRTTTLAGALDRLANSTNHLLGSLLELPSTVAFLNQVATVMDKLADHAHELAEVIKTLFFGLQLGAGGLARDAANPATAAGKQGALATERTAQQIADNTKMTADAIENAILGGPGLRAKQAFTFRDAKIALSI